MRTLLARLVLMVAAIPGLGVDAEAVATVLSNTEERTVHGLEERLERDLRECVLPYLDEYHTPDEDLVMNVMIEPDGNLRVVNMHGGNRAMRGAVRSKYTNRQHQGLAPLAGGKDTEDQSR